MKNRKRLVTAALVLVVATALGVWILRPSKPPPRRMAPEGSIWAADLSRLAAATFVRPQSVAEVVNLADQLEQAVLQAAQNLPNDLSLTDAKARDLARLARTRIDLLLAPDYQKYRQHVKDLTGRDPDGAGPVGVVTSLEDWNSYSTKFELIPIDVTRVEVRCHYHQGKELDTYRPGGHVTTIVDANKFYSTVETMTRKTPLAKSATDRYDIYVVSVPVEIVPDKESAEPIRVLYILSAVWLQDRQRWAPWESGFNDVEDNSDAWLPPAWL